MNKLSAGMIVRHLVLISLLFLAMTITVRAEIVDLEAQVQHQPAQVKFLSTPTDVSLGKSAFIHIEGYKSLQCVRLNEVSISRKGNDFFLAVSEQPVPENIRCVPGLYPFQTDIELRTAHLGPGKYSVHAHGLSIYFVVHG